MLATAQNFSHRRMAPFGLRSRYDDSEKTVEKCGWTGSNQHTVVLRWAEPTLLAVFLYSCLHSTNFVLTFFPSLLQFSTKSAPCEG